MINSDFIGRLEGYETVGYVPKPDGGAIESGVTIASGFDIGQRSSQSLPPSLRAKLAIYCGYTGHAAINFLNSFPLSLTDEECRVVNEYAHKEAMDRLLRSWPASAVPFSCLADECQTVVASVAFQYGSLAKRCPNFWRQVTTGDWHGSLKNLRNFGDAFSTRRNKEADLLESRLDEG